MKKISAAAAICIALLLCSACYDNREIDETAYIIAIGIDDADDGNYKYTFQFSAPLAMTDGGGGGEKDGDGIKKDDETEKIEDSGNASVRNVVIKAPDFYVARGMINNFMSKNIDMSHLKIIVFSSKVDSDALTKHSQLFLHEREVRPHTALAVAERSAEEYIRSVNPELEVNTAKYYELMSLRSNNIYAPSKRLRDFVDESSSGGDSVLPIACVAKYEGSEEFKTEKTDDSLWVKSGDARVSSSRSDLRGMAIFRDGRLTGAMDGDSALVFNILNRDIKNCTLSVRNKYNTDETVTFRVFVPKAASYRVEEVGGKTVIGVTQRLDAEYIGGQLPEGYRSYDELYTQLQTVANKKFSDFLYSLSREQKADIMNIEKKCRYRYLTWDQKETMNWEKNYQNAMIEVRLEIV